MKTTLPFIFLLVYSLVNSQTTVQYAQQTNNYDATFYNDGGIWDDVPNSQMNIWTWEASGGDGVLQVAAWKNFTDDGTTTGNPITMAVGDSFKISLSASKSWTGQIGVSLLASPTSKSSYDDRHNNYAVQINKNGDLPWEITSSGGTINSTTISSGDLWYDYEFIFSLESVSTMTVVINKYTIDDHASVLETESNSITLNNSDITGYAVYADNWLNGDFRLKQPTEYSRNALGTEEMKALHDGLIYYHENQIKFKGGKTPQNYHISLYDLGGRYVGSVDQNNNRLILPSSIYIIRTEIDGHKKQREKLL